VEAGETCSRLSVHSDANRDGDHGRNAEESSVLKKQDATDGAEKAKTSGPTALSQTKSGEQIRRNKAFPVEVTQKGNSKLVTTGELTKPGGHNRGFHGPLRFHIALIKVELDCNRRCLE